MSIELQPQTRPGQSANVDDPGRASEVDARWAWAEYEPDASRPWTLATAGHLYRRAAFGANWKELERALADGPKRTVDRLVHPEEDLAAFDRSIGEYEDASAGSGGAESLRAWWLRRMLQTPHPLLEKMTLFWHSHFGISNSRVGNARLMLHHVRLLRKHALGRYQSLLEAVATDPAVFLGLGADVSRKSLPNENFPRQLMQHLSLGPGQFGEEDVREAARAFTGWVVLRGRLRFFDREHDTGKKSVLGKTGNWGVEDVVRIVLEQPVAPRLLVQKLYRWLISEVDQPHDELLDPLVGMLAEDYDVGRVVETMLRSNQFFSPAAYRQRIKSPVEYALGIVRGLEGTVSTVRLGEDLSQLGQNLYHPPTVQGWHGGRYWINAATMTGRSNLAQALFAPKGPYGGKLDPAAITKSYDRNDPESSARLLVSMFLQDDLSDNLRKALLSTVPAASTDATPWLREFACGVVTLPEFQLC